MDITKIKPDIRHLYDMKEVIFDKDWLKTAPDLELYYMYRDLAENEEDKEKIAKANLRYDITVMQPQMLGKEFNKTAGHIHSLVPNTNLTYPEIYEVLGGEAMFLIQNINNDSAIDVYAVKAQKNDKIIVPPNYSHIMINIGKEEFKTANLLSRDCSNIYDPIKKKEGFCYFAVQENNSIKWIKNENYQKIPELRFSQANQLLEQFSIAKDKSLYSLVNDLEKFDFLKNPQDYKWK